MKKLLAIALVAVFTTSALASCAGTVESGATAGSDQYYASDVYNDGIIENNTDEAVTDDAGNDDSVTDDSNEDGNKEDNKEDNKTEEKEEDEEPQEKPTFNVKESTSGLKFALNEDKLSYTLVGKGSCSATSIVIDGHNGLPVTHVGYSAFGDDKKITSVTFGDYVEVIEDQAFSMCSALTSVKFGKNVKFLGDYSFRYCTSLTSIELGKNIEVIKYGTFYKASKLATIKMYSNVRVIEEYAFDGTAYFANSSNWKNKVLYIGTNLVKAKSDISGSYTVTSGTTCIGGLAFANCKSFSGITIPDSVHSIGLKAFKNATSLKNINIGLGVSYIGDESFTNTGFYNTSSNWKNGVLYVGKYIVAAKTTLSGTYTVASGTRVISDMAFNACKSLTSIVVPDSVVYVGEYAFLGCEKLATVTLGTGVKEIGIYAFKDCSALKSITMKKTTGWSAGKTSVSSDKLSNKDSAAVYVGIYYSDKVWTRG